ncbi:hypothetical protein AJ79_00226 [Helicocarpus griseus UAMH5409]|uniref:Uncharacterized protein n=1 Tax=Helicocarpus griseus UAMH5409 TaxID=1447875 RepID=A0A2B7YCP9_9EURO|nr:hypothetical protein AJ79_00226 [Helicocarpus griseus UAMH5409]
MQNGQAERSLIICFTGPNTKNWYGGATDSEDAPTPNEEDPTTLYGEDANPHALALPEDPEYDIITEPIIGTKPFLDVYRKAKKTPTPIPDTRVHDMEDSVAAQCLVFWYT